MSHRSPLLVTFIITGENEQFCLMPKGNTLRHTPRFVYTQQEDYTKKVGTYGPCVLKANIKGRFYANVLSRYIWTYPLQLCMTIIS